MNYPILEYDPSPTAVIEPSRVLPRLDTMPRCAVLCFFQEVITTVCADAEHVTHLRSEIGANPVYALAHDGARVAVTHAGLGAPLAAGFMDELIALGCDTFILCGSAGALNRELVVGHLVVPSSAVRDEGTSYHYLPPAREVAPTPAALDALCGVLDAAGAPYLRGKTWTTDAFYRETPARVAARRAEGCVTVEMEASALFAVARFRGVRCAALLYCSDDVSGDNWDVRGAEPRAPIRERVFWLAVNAAAKLGGTA